MDECSGFIYLVGLMGTAAIVIALGLVNTAVVVLWLINIIDVLTF